ncbi:hypothetical protein DAEQUDRAFT_671259 [Daedalea quercina L-15889]|uniref:Uncharacterized protein n=1 Tax=Daedalea quercina L-15889 TaxID=1314783 RepID=A0A165PNY4_9APHY|nr:hypothetical protein DAEQUDRAFT_671259 [Daedalea quercina L-15889]
MAGPPRQQHLPRLHIPPNLSQQQPVSFDNHGSLFSPALPTSIQQGMHPSFMNMPNPLQTPMQTNFFPQPPPAPGRPSMHRSSPSVVHLAAAGIYPPNMPMTPLGQPGFPNPLLGMPQFPPPFVPRSKRAPSISVGGPPKAVLGGPQRKVSPNPVGPGATQPAPVPRVKKHIVNLPKETVPGEGDAPSMRKPWARKPLLPSEVPVQGEVAQPDTRTAEPYPPDNWRHHLPSTVDVFLPGKGAWADIKQKIIEEKLEKLGVERGGGGSVPQIHVPHARAASISSPADPALLMFKLNKLQQSQNASASNSLATSPQPPSSTSPGQLPPRFQGRHGHSMSLAQPPSLQAHSPVYNPAAAFNPFGPGATLGSDQVQRVSPGPARLDIQAPQGRAPANFASLAPPPTLSRPESRPDFMRGFGVEIPEEEEPEEERPAPIEIIEEGVETEVEDAGNDEEDVSTVAQSRIHSRHVSKLSAALSLRSVGGIIDDGSSTFVDAQRVPVPARSPDGSPMVEDVDEYDDHDQEAVGEWTGSEDLRTGAETSEDESIGEWSNPSDEERARHERVQRRMLRRQRQQSQHDIGIETHTPRRLPNFPRPPDLATTFVDQDDIVSNPSEEESAREPFNFGARGHFPRPSSSGHGRPLPPLPEARPGSAPYSYHDPALAHSRGASEQLPQPGGLHPPPVQPQPAPALRTESLNPLAKPFVFGANRQSGSFSSAVFNPPAISTPNLGHSRAPSFGKPLSAAAPEFKPGFTFRPPPGVPQLVFSSPQPPRPLPTPPLASAVTPSKVGRENQGREKRQRRGSSASLDGEDEDGVNTMSSFKFPPDITKAMSAPTSPPGGSLGLRESTLNAAAKPFTVSGYSGTLGLSHQPRAFTEGDENTPPPGASSEPEAASELPFPPTMKPKRAPIPLDFKHPVSTNTVPAGLFKALVSTEGDDRTRRTVRSRLSSRDIFEHSPRPSLDDLNVPPISHRISRNRLFTEPGLREPSPPNDIFTPERIVRRSSAPTRHHHRGSDDDDSGSEISLPPVNLSRRIEMQQYEQRLEYLLEEKFDIIRGTLSEFKETGGQTLSPSTEAMISEVVSLFRAQLQASAARGLEDSQMDARGELDFEMMKGVIEQKHTEQRVLIQQDLVQLFAARSRDPAFMQFAEELSSRTVNAVAGATSQLSMQMQAMEANRPPSDSQTIAHELMRVLMPQIASLRPEPIDYEGLTSQLTQAVKPHIAQLIDLASDKRETAGLIVDKLRPLLPALASPTPAIDEEAIVGRLTTEVRKIVAPLDAHEIKEQVSDLVVERLDSRLAVRDRAFNVDALTDKVTQSIAEVMAPIRELQVAVSTLGEKTPEVQNVPQVDLSSVREDMLGVLSDLPQQLVAATEALGSAQAEFKTRADKAEKDTPNPQNLSHIEASVRDVAREQQRLISQTQEFSDFCQDIIKHINTLPEAMLEATRILQNAHADFTARDTSQKDAEEIRRLMNANGELQVQLQKARSQHGQVRVEKDLLVDRLNATEADRDRLSTRVETLEESITVKTSELTAAEAKNVELEEALARALERLKAADVQAQTDSQRIAELDSSNRELNAEKQQLKARVDSLDLRVTFITREKELVTDELATQRRYHEELVAQRGSWDDLRAAAEQIQVLTKLVGQADTEELKELRRIRDRSRTLETEHAALQRRVKENETKLSASEKVAQASKQSLVQAQQRAVEWERRAKEASGELELTQQKLDSAEEARAQLDADYSLAKLQLEERDAEERLDKDRQNKLRDQIAALEAQVARLQAETDQANKAAAAAKVAQPKARYQNGNGNARPPARPDSRTSTVYDESRAVTPTAQCKSSDPVVRAATPQQSVWDSIHAPRRPAATAAPATPLAKKAHGYYRPQIPSPTPSNVSAAPTLGDDGWWS